ncbi:MAG: ribonuclease III [Rothia sp. (in: high G+C Gram-positive bacteria)]|uniref:ribonuclease III n=1 Tax=Rothia sp. (in: high G+C Gram-positive bacteria) TaxID=1885016 RepID=UPI0026DF333E|nr:ribonuclease III [Rothia sp. (in: high G+C Gram-positive bacteria)]MDO5750950.1 ribonuclease III [Rothia sp. (in: high G+C Gram-positive bacteria)]
MSEPSVKDARELQKRLGVDIDAETFLLSLTHRSYAFEHGEIAHNERLEFVGDSVLSLAIAEEVYRRFPELPEGELVRLHHAVVSTVALAKIARTLHLGDYILLGKGERMTGGANKDSILADTMEAIFGAVYLTLGRERAREVVLQFISPLLDDEAFLDSGRDWKTELYNLAFAHSWGDIRYEVTGEGPDHARLYTATAYVANQQVARGTQATTKKEAERSAAQAAYKVLHRD